MRPTPDPEVPRLCNSCILKEERRNPKKKDDMDYVDILIKCPVKEQAKIEEYCMKEGFTFSEYFLKLHHKFMVKDQPTTSLQTNQQKDESEEYPEKDRSEKKQEGKRSRKNSNE